MSQMYRPNVDGQGGAGLREAMRRGLNIEIVKSSLSIARSQCRSMELGAGRRRPTLTLRPELVQV